MVAVGKLNLLQLEVLRLKRKGLRNNGIALLLFVAFFIVSHAIGRMLWDYLFEPHFRAEHRQLVIVIGGSLIHTATAIACILFFLPLYRGQSSWLDNYAIEVIASVTQGNRPWHWKRPYWPSLRNRTILTLLLVHVVYFPIGMYLSSKNTLVRFERFPSMYRLL